MDNTALEIRALLEEQSRLLRREITRPRPATPLGKNDVIRTLGSLITILAAVAAFTLWLFKTNMEAEMEHAELVQRDMQIKAEHITDAKVQEQINKQMEQQLQAINNNIVRVGKKVRAKGLEE